MAITEDIQLLLNNNEEDMIPKTNIPETTNNTVLDVTESYNRAIENAYESACRYENEKRPWDHVNEKFVFAHAFGKKIFFVAEKDEHNFDRILYEIEEKMPGENEFFESNPENVLYAPKADPEMEGRFRSEVVIRDVLTERDPLAKIAAPDLSRGKRVAIQCAIESAGVLRLGMNEKLLGAFETAGGMAVGLRIEQDNGLLRTYFFHEKPLVKIWKEVISELVTGIDRGYRNLKERGAVPPELPDLRLRGLVEQLRKTGTVGHEFIQTAKQLAVKMESEGPSRPEAQVST